MEDMDFGRASIDNIATTSSDESTEILVDTAHQTSIDDTPPEVGKFSLTNNANEEIVLGEPKGQLRNANNQIINEQGTAIPVQINLISKRDHEWKLLLQDYLNPGRTYSNRFAIKLPKDDTKKSGVSLEYLFMVRQNPFRRTISEHPHDHIEYLEDMKDDEYNRCKLFPFSLEGDARKWLNQLPTESSTCWKEIRGTFINQFFDEARYWDVRKKISTFCQCPRESFRNAWERLKSYQLECPHHGYSEPQLINTFYGGINLHYQITLDTTSEGSFSTRKPEEARRLIKNVTTGRSYEMMGVERGRRVDSIDGSPLVKNKETLDSFQSALEGQSQFGIYQIDDDTLSELEQQVNFVDTQTLKNKYPIPNPDSFTQNYDATVGSRRGRAKFRLNQAFTGNSKLATDLNGKIDILYSELMRKFDALSEHIKRLDGQVAEDATAIKSEA
ncbi:hypothetical protein DY000_02031225 [Brassica cretica]|uniref:Retrotransposon gag domain-containing protein n=1 Tax=Brassica cretica TaxID=69181 RepID=A0ABQ7DK82_BRACR|nr:hypothetical protein DY000_02031225 [Brassica cretica]